MVTLQDEDQEFEQTLQKDNLSFDELESKKVYQVQQSKNIITIEHTQADIYRLAVRILMMERKKLIEANLSSQLPLLS